MKVGDLVVVNTRAFGRIGSYKGCLAKILVKDKEWDFNVLIGKDICFALRRELSPLPSFLQNESEEFIKLYYAL